MKVALFTKVFLEPTHHAIVQIIEKLTDCTYDVYSKAFRDTDFFDLNNINDRILYDEVDYVKFNSLRYSFIHAIFDGTTVFKAYDIAQAFNIPFLVSFHGGHDTNVKIFDPRYTMQILTMLENATEVTVVCAMDIQRLEKIGLKRNINIIPVPVDFTILPPRISKKDSFGIITIGRLVEKKGIDISLRVLSQLPDVFVLTIIGDGILDVELKELSKNLKVSNRVRWLGSLSLDDTLSELNKNSILLHPSKLANNGNAEGTPQTILWAQALRIPVITSSSGSICDIVEDQKTGIIVKGDKIDDYVKAVMQLNDPNFVVSLTENAFNNVKSKNSISYVAQEWDRLYKKLKNANRRNNKPLDKLLFSNKYVIDSLIKAYRYLGIKEDSVIPFDNGGIGVLFLAKSVNHDDYIIKIPAYSNRPQAEHWILKHNILKEGQALSLLKNRAIPKLIYYEPNGEYIIREYIKGDKLSQLPPETTIQRRIKLFYNLYNTAKIVFEDIHDNRLGNYVLRDFKPANLICPSENFDLLYLVDIGSIREESNMVGNSLNVKRVGSRKWLYWSPEQLLEDINLLDRRTDYFSFGATAFFILTGKPPYSNSTAEKSKVMDKYFQEYINIKNDLDAFFKTRDLPIKFINLIINCLHPIPNYRSFN